MKTTDDQYFITHQKLIISNTVTESDIYDNYSYTSYVNWEIEKAPETTSKTLECVINKPETGLKMIDFNIITNNDEIHDMNDHKIIYPSDNQTIDMYSKRNHQNVQQKRNTHNNLYTFTNYKLQLSSDLEDLNGTDDWKSTNSHKSEVGIAYDNKVGNNALHPKIFYTWYIKQNGNNNGHLIYYLSTDKTVVTI